MLLLLLAPVSVFAQSTPQFPFSHQQPHQGTTIIPDGHGGYWQQQTPGGLSAYGAMSMEQGLREMSKPSYQPSYQSPPITIDIPYNYRDPVREANDRFLDHR